jgi:hypothetical protein
MVLIDWIPACFLFVIGITLSLQHRNKEVSSEKIRMNSLRKGFLFLAIGLIFSPMWSMDIFIILGVSYIIGSMIFQWEMMLLNVVVIALLFLGLVLINLDVRVFYHYSLLDLQESDFSELTSFIAFNGYYSVVPWVGFFVAGMAFGKGQIKPKGWFPPTTFIGIGLILVSLLTQRYCEALYDNVWMPSKSHFLPVKWTMFQPAFVFFAIGLSWILVNISNYIFTFVDNETFKARLRAMSKTKYSFLFITTFLATIVMALSNVTGTLPLALSDPFRVFIYLLFIILITNWINSTWVKKVNKYPMIEWLIKSISISNKESA